MYCTPYQIDECVVIVGRSNAKSILDVMIALIELFLFPKPNSVIALMATKKDQAEKILMKHFRAMGNCPGTVINKFKNQFKLNKEQILVKDNSILKSKGTEISIYASNEDTLDGGREQLVIIDEFGAFKKNPLVTIRQGLRKNKGTLFISTTNNVIRGGAYDDELESWKEWVKDDDFSHWVFYYALDDYEEVKHSSKYIKANPALGYTLTLEDIQKDYILDVKEEDMVPNRYEITLPSGEDDYTILPEKEGETQIEYGEDYSFTVKTSKDQCILVYAYGTVIEFADGKYTIRNVTEPQEITVKYVEKHTWGEWKETVKPTYEKEGEETRICSVCGATDKKVVEKLIKEEKPEKPEEPEKDQPTPETQYTITYVLNKGINHKNNPSTYTSDQSVVLSSPSRKGYEFKGWYTDSKCKKKITSIQKGSKTNYTVYAKWSKITLKKVQKLKLSNTKKKKMVVKYAKVSGTQGYEIVYATNSKFKKGKKIVQTGKRKVTIGKLKKNKVYYVRVRAFKKDSTGKNVYGKYSSTKKIKIKK